jgi:hypothetical protein
VLTFHGCLSFIARGDSPDAWEIERPKTTGQTDPVLRLLRQGNVDIPARDFPAGPRQPLAFNFADSHFGRDDVRQHFMAGHQDRSPNG